MSKYLSMNKKKMIDEIKEYQKMLREVLDLYIMLQEIYVNEKGGRLEDTEDIEEKLEEDIEQMSLLTKTSEKRNNKKLKEEIKFRERK
ncbi:hypothetical protein CRV08_08585 [Halarcobacter ebronensis]|uniref:Uncharacterized protein n=1 Tax=Halarcobacter ebronensis TaxID=1462615 RepID=A0A4Q0YCY3_9BACT|nr:hypothetical protein [Halarcobacter ebronensis]RXJ68297.1 hypothetical protein CRV08_08585 [Halarcobacter ebronensis]